MLLQLTNITKEYNERKILQSAELLIHRQEKIGIVGENGCGKSTLAKIITGELIQDSGDIRPLPDTLNIAYLPQSIFDTIDMTTLSNEERENLSKIGVPSKLEYSSGEKMKIAIAKVWSTNPELVILDEPTNHLDREGVEWLIKEIQQFKGTVMVISHDRYFLDQTVTKIIEINSGEIHEYHGNYSVYKEEKKIRENIQFHHYESQVKVVRQIEEQIQSLRQWSNEAHEKAGKGGTRSENRQLGLREFERKKAKKRDQQTKSMMKRLTKEKEQITLLKPKEETTVHFQFNHHKKQGKAIIQAINLAFGYGGEKLVENSSFYINHGERIGLIGKNGSGKTSFIRALTGTLPIAEGELWKSSSSKIGYLSQTHEWGSIKGTVLEHIGCNGIDELASIRTMLVNIGLPRDMHHSDMETLSFGERIRVELVKMITESYDLLILDEPTNHLDIKSREMLEETLTSFKGTLLIVSHDQYFMDKMCNKILVLEQNMLTRYELSLKEYVNRDAHLTEINEELLRIQNRMNYVLGKLSIISPASGEYLELDQEFQSLLIRKKELSM
ncbi:ABC-F family ATP-binding cassette domain-containing protein [Bacillus sp. BGMRC 2118]|nr:ABC-F family ATP-binding cassette domain-containing protein [Bacillus sp. BGMRC 2118]